MRNEGRITPRVAATAPQKPFFFKPTYVAQLIAMGPGVDSAITVISIISSWVIHSFPVTQTFSISGIIAYPPPKVNNPIFENVKNSSNSNFIFRSVDLSISPE